MRRLKLNWIDLDSAAADDDDEEVRPRDCGANDKLPSTLCPKHHFFNGRRFLKAKYSRLHTASEVGHFGL